MPNQKENWILTSRGIANLRCPSCEKMTVVEAVKKESDGFIYAKCVSCEWNKPLGKM